MLLRLKSIPGQLLQIRIYIALMLRSTLTITLCSDKRSQQDFTNKVWTQLLLQIKMQMKKKLSKLDLTTQHQMEILVAWLTVQVLLWQRWISFNLRVESQLIFLTLVAVPLQLKLKLASKSYLNILKLKPFSSISLEE